MFRTVIEILGRPQEHVEASLQKYVKSIKENKRFEFISENFAEAKKQEDQELWSVFVELELGAEKVEDLIFFCFDYMPSVIEIIEPSELKMTDNQFSNLLSDLQGKLHEVDMVAKQVKMENEHLKKNMGALLKNYVVVLLGTGRLDSEHLSRLTGVSSDKLEDFLDQLIDEGRIDLKDGLYFLKGEVFKHGS